MDPHVAALRRVADDIEAALSCRPRDCMGAVVWSSGEVSVVPRRVVTHAEGDGVPVMVWVDGESRVVWHRRQT